MSILSALAGWKGYAAVAAISGVVAGAGVGVVQKWRYGAEISALQATRAQELQAASDAAYQASEKYRTLEQIQQEAADAAREQFQAQQAAASVAAAGAAAELGRLRQQLDALARRGGDPAEAPDAGPGADGATDGAAVLRFVVGQCVDRYIDVAAEADRLGARLMGLQGYVRAIR
ncbi:DUF2514 family protein [Pigmentiphaga sp. YJ18]|uniref:DUF2514 family protein n=1 Tax=Pigmentiphaga sp. YJ18 TaxID=3134907 RepID=UPI00310F6735